MGTIGKEFQFGAMKPIKMQKYKGFQYNLTYNPIPIIIYHCKTETLKKKGIGKISVAW